VRVTSHPALAYVGVGSNIHPEENVRRALGALAQKPGVTLTGISTFYRTAPIPDPTNSTSLPDQGPSGLDPDFLNGVLEIRTALSSHELLTLFAQVEEALGRERHGRRFAPRTIDLDLLLFGREVAPDGLPVWEEIGPQKYLAHSDIERRSFVAHPLLELAPGLILPPYGAPLRAFAASFETPGGKREIELTAALRSRFLATLTELPLP